MFLRPEKASEVKCENLEDTFLLKNRQLNRRLKVDHYFHNDYPETKELSRIYEHSGLKTFRKWLRRRKSRTLQWHLTSTLLQCKNDKKVFQLE